MPKVLTTTLKPAAQFVPLQINAWIQPISSPRACSNVQQAAGFSEVSQGVSGLSGLITFLLDDVANVQ